MHTDQVFSKSAIITMCVINFRLHLIAATGMASMLSGVTLLISIMVALLAH